MSTGASTLAEIDIAIQAIKDAGGTELALLHCILNYPTPDEHAHLGMIDGLLRVYPEYVIGYSDHTLPDEKMLVVTAACIKGARIIEKHFTHDKSLPGNDHYHAMDVQDLKHFKANLNRLGILEGHSHKHPLATEAISREHARRSIVVAQNLAKGTKLDAFMLTYKRPAHGISPLHWDEVIGKTIQHDLPEDHILQWSDLE